MLGDRLPTQAEELADPGAVDERYDDSVARLRGLTRNNRKFRLLFSENINYGLRRNLLGLKPIGVAVACGTLMTGLITGLLAVWG